MDRGQQSTGGGAEGAQNQRQVSGEHGVEPLHGPPSTRARAQYSRSSRGWGEGIYLPKGQFIFTGDLGSLTVSSFLKLTCKMRSYKPGSEVSREGGQALSLKHHQASFASPTPHPQIALPSAFCRRMVKTTQESQGSGSPQTNCKPGISNGLISPGT